MITKNMNRALESMAREEIENEIKGEEWPDPIPINCFDNLPDFPSSLIPSPGREMIEAVAEVNQVDVGMPGSIYLAVLSTCLARKGEIKLHPHTEPLNIFVCSVAESGERKSGTIKLMTAPLYEYQKDKEIEMQDDIREATSKFKTNELRIAHLQKQAAKKDDGIQLTEIQHKMFQLDKKISENPIPKTPIFIVDDITSEATGEIMANNNERLSIISSEGGIFSIMAGRYNERGGPNFDIYLKGHSGDPWSSHRRGKASNTMSAPTLTMCLTVQYDVIKEIGNKSYFRGRGLLARYLYNLNKPKAGTRSRQTQNISPATFNSYSKHIRDLMDIPLELTTLNVSKEGQDAWGEFYEDIEKEMSAGGSLETLKDWGSKLPGSVARIAGLLHYAQYGIDAVDTPISVDIVNASCAIGIYYMQHALAVFGLMRVDPRIEAAKKILEYIERHNPGSFKGRDVLRHKHAFETMDDIRPGLSILIERGFIRENVLSISPNIGRPEATVYDVNPKLKILETHRQ